MSFVRDTAPTEIYTLSLHDALPISSRRPACPTAWTMSRATCSRPSLAVPTTRSEEHTSELQSQSNLVCRLLLEKKNIWLERFSPHFTRADEIGIRNIQPVPACERVY